MITNYSLIIKFWVYFIVSSLLTILLFILPYLLNYRVVSLSEKLTSYECGFEPYNDSKGIFNIQFYIVGIIFIIFDLEIIYLIPWSKNLY